MKRPKVHSMRRKFERETLDKLRAAGATPLELTRFRWLLTKGRKTPEQSYQEVLQRNSFEKFGIQLALQCLEGLPPEQIIFRIRPVPEVAPCG